MLFSSVIRVLVPGHLVLTADLGRLQDAYKAAAYQFARGEYNEFKDQREFTGYIKATVEDHPLEVGECPRCDKWSKD